MRLDVVSRIPHLCPGWACAACRYMKWAALPLKDRQRLQVFTRRVQAKARKALASSE